MHISWMMLRKQGALNNQMLRLGCCLPPLVKIPGYVPAPVPCTTFCFVCFYRPAFCRVCDHTMDVVRAH